MVKSFYLNGIQYDEETYSTIMQEREGLPWYKNQSMKAYFQIIETNMEQPIVINAKKCKECNVPKGWGHEIIFENNELYCGKLLVFKKGCNFSMHYHLIKDETWYVQEGEFLYRWIDTETELN